MHQLREQNLSSSWHIDMPKITMSKASNIGINFGGEDAELCVQFSSHNKGFVRLQPAVMLL